MPRTISAPIFFVVALVIATILYPALPAQAGGLSLDLPPQAGQAVGRTVQINTGYALTFEIDVPTAFSVTIPEFEGLTSAPLTADDPSVRLFKVAFVGRNPDVPDDIFVVESIEFFNVSAPMGDAAARIEALGQKIGGQIFPAATRGLDQIKTISGRAIQVGEYDAVEIIGTYMDPQSGENALRFVAVLNPDGEDCVLSISSVTTKYYKLSNPADLAMTASGTVMQSFQYSD